MENNKQNHLVRMFMFFIAIANAIFIFQFTNIALAKGLEEELALKVYSIVQLSVLASIYLDNYLLKYIHNSILINFTFLARVVLLCVMFVTVNPVVFALTFILYGFVFSGFDVIIESIVSLISIGNNVEYGKIRRFYSIGYAINGVFAFVVMIFFPPEYLILMVLILNLLGWAASLILNFETKKHSESVNKIDLQTLLFTTIIMLTVVTPGLFAVNLNTHLETQYGITIQMAAFFGGFAVIIGSLISEVFGMSKVGNLIKNNGPIKIIKWAMYITLVRWILSLIAPTPFIFMLTYFLHGVSFAFAFIGGIEFINKYIDHKKVPTFISYNTVLSALFTSLALFVLSNAIAVNGTQIIIVFNIIVTIFTIFMFKWFLNKYQIQGDK